MMFRLIHETEDIEEVFKIHRCLKKLGYKEVVDYVFTTEKGVNYLRMRDSAYQDYLKRKMIKG